MRGVGSTARDMPSEQATSAATSCELADIFREHCDFVWRVLRRFGLSEAEAEDGVQEVFVVVARKLGEYEERGALRAWLFVVARQVASHARRADQRRQRKNLLVEPPAPYPDPQQLVERRQAAALVDEFVAQLDEGQALVFLLSEIEGLSAPEIAAALTLELSTVYGRQRLSRKRFEVFVRRHSKGGAS
jgi:RNA polymerase sigma-70 factor (ECF subfamily)